MYDNVEDFLAVEQNKHQCDCGCREIIQLKKSHYWNGIPKFIFGHAARLRQGRKEYDKDLYYSVEDIAELANVSDQTVRLWNRNNKIIASSTIGRKNLYLKTEINDFLTSRPQRSAFVESNYYSIQDLKLMGVSRSKLRILVRNGKIEEPRHHARRTYYLKSEIDTFLKQIMSTSINKPQDFRPQSAYTKLLKQVKMLENRVKMLEDCLLRG